MNTEGLDFVSKESWAWTWNPPHCEFVCCKTPGFVQVWGYLTNLCNIMLNSLHRNAKTMTEDSAWSYNNALLITLVSIVPISAYALFWAVCNMVFHREFTACPENYNAVHDPASTLVNTATMLEGALDVVSCASLLSLATDTSVSIIFGLNNL